MLAAVDGSTSKFALLSSVIPWLLVPSVADLPLSWEDVSGGPDRGHCLRQELCDPGVPSARLCGD
jgi:hypothetical protein